MERIGGSGCWDLARLCPCWLLVLFRGEELRDRNGIPDVRELIGLGPQ